LLPTFNQDDLESYLTSFERISELNSWPDDKLVAILHYQLKGKALKVFAELPAEDCKIYSKIKEALFIKLQLVPESYRVQFRSLTKKTDSDFALRLNRGRCDQ
jgi:hypothetical protein